LLAKAWVPYTDSRSNRREVFRGAIVNGAAAIILAHNHPSGDPTPSRQDLEALLPSCAHCGEISVTVRERATTRRRTSSCAGTTSSASRQATTSDADLAGPFLSGPATDSSVAEVIKRDEFKIPGHNVARSEFPRWHLRL
jgi:hypothetical protein